jgi:hypothetical protein
VARVRRRRIHLSPRVHGRSHFGQCTFCRLSPNRGVHGRWLRWTLEAKSEHVRGRRYGEDLRIAKARLRREHTKRMVGVDMTVGCKCHQRILPILDDIA